jgi:glyoxylase-like metal-dependent hydrolase (beta-lactamase superfamily II)
MLIQHPDAGNILVDVGIGEKWDAKGQKIYKIRHATSQGLVGLNAGLAKFGLTTDDIDHVVLTHLHFDHAGGLTRWDDGDPDAVVPAFPGRPHYVMRDHWKWAQNPSERDAGSFRKMDFEFLDGGDAELVLVDGHTELFDGVTLIPRFGHTESMACVKVDASDGTYIFMADLIPTSGHIKVPYVMAYDLNPKITCREKREILSEAARRGWRLAFQHDPIVEWCRVEEDGRGGYRIPT